MDTLTINVRLHFKPDMDASPYPDPMTNSNAALVVIQQAVQQALVEHGWKPDGFQLDIEATRSRF